MFSRLHVGSQRYWVHLYTVLLCLEHTSNIVVTAMTYNVYSSSNSMFFSLNVLNLCPIV